MIDETASLSEIPRELSLQPISRRPTVLPRATVAAAMKLAPPFLVPMTGSNISKIQTSIIIVTFNGEAFTRMCLASVIANSDSPTYEIIIVDNGSTDQTALFLQSLVMHHDHVRIVLNPGNRGFAAANNQGLALAKGKVLVLLNNDTIVPPGWLARLESHLCSPNIGLVGPVTNRAQNESKIDTTYDTYGQFLDFARQKSIEYRGQSFEIPMLMMFAVVMRREVFEAVGPLDENFGIGMFEDDDYAIRVRELGYRVICARDTFVHHFGQASFGTLDAGGEFNRIFDRNRHYFQQKWKRSWKPHQPQESQDHQSLIDAVVQLIGECKPLAVISNADEELLLALRHRGLAARHFPQESDGSAVAHHPRDGQESLALLRADQAAGAVYLVIPKPYFWWLDFYTELAAELHQHCRRLDPPDGCCVIFDLSTLPQKAANP